MSLSNEELKIGMSFLHTPFSHLYNLCTYMFQIRRKRAADLYIRLSLKTVSEVSKTVTRFSYLLEDSQGPEIIVYIIMVYSANG